MNNTNAKQRLLIGAKLAGDYKDHLELLNGVLKKEYKIDYPDICIKIPITISKFWFL